MNIIAPTKYTKENCKYTTSVKTICDEKIEIYTNDVEEIENCEHKAITEAIQHNELLLH